MDNSALEKGLGGAQKIYRGGGVSEIAVGGCELESWRNGGGTDDARVPDAASAWRLGWRRGVNALRLGWRKGVNALRLGWLGVMGAWRMVWHRFRRREVAAGAGLRGRREVTEEAGSTSRRGEVAAVRLVWRKGKGWRGGMVVFMALALFASVLFGVSAAFATYAAAEVQQQLMQDGGSGGGDGDTSGGGSGGASGGGAGGISESGSGGASGGAAGGVDGGTSGGGSGGTSEGGSQGGSGGTSESGSGGSSEGGSDGDGGDFWGRF